MPRIETTVQKNQGNHFVMSGRVSIPVYETAIRVAELNGYETISAFVKDAILDKIQSTAYAMSAICKEEKTKQPSSEF